MEIFLFFLFAQVKLQVSQDIKRIVWKQVFFLFVQFIFLCILNQLNMHSMATIVIFCVIDVIYAILFFEDTVMLRIFWGCMYSIICIISEYVTFFVLQAFSESATLEILLGGRLRMPFTMLYIAFIGVLVFLFCGISNKTIRFTIKQKLSYLLISIVGIMIGHFIMLITLESEQRFQDETFTSQLVLVNLCFIALFLFLLFYIYQLGYSNEQNKKLMEHEKIRKLEELEYQNLLKSTASLREMKHDMEIHLDVIQGLATKNEREKLISYIESYHQSLMSAHHLISTGNTAIDCIVSSKLDAAQKARIKTDFSIMLPKQFPLDTLSLSSLLGNLWNNAIEANLRLMEHVKECNPYIRFFIKPFQHMVIIHIENSYDGMIRMTSNKSFISTKEGIEHGLGMKRIHDIVKHGEGIIQIQTEHNIFSVHILLPLKEHTNENVNNNT